MSLKESQTSPLQPSLPVGVKVLLVDDQPIIAEAIRRMLEGEKDVSFFYCQNPLEALKTAAEVKPTVILQDLVMPDVDGLMLVKYFRANSATKDMPLVVLSSKEDADTKYRAFQNGANDYMVKLPDKLEVIARIRYHSAAYNNLCQKNLAMRKLQESQAALKQELEQAEQYVENLLPKRLDDDIVKTDWIFKSSNELGGDCFGYNRMDAENFCVYLLDVCGHGVGAALLSVSVVNVLRSQSLPEVDFKKPSQVLGALNNAFDMEKQNGMYFTLWYGVYNAAEKTLTFASGGHPPAILVSADGAARELSTGGMVIGGMPDMKFSEKTVDARAGDKLYVFSDGVYEVENAETKEMEDFDDFKARLVSNTVAGGHKLRGMFEYAAQLQNSEQFKDDYSMCEISLK